MQVCIRSKKKKMELNTLHHLCSGIMRHLRHTSKPNIDFFGDSEFVTFRATLDAEMKRVISYLKRSILKFKKVPAGGILSASGGGIVSAQGTWSRSRGFYRV